MNALAQLLQRRTARLTVFALILIAVPAIAAGTVAANGWADSPHGDFSVDFTMRHAGEKSFYAVSVVCLEKRCRLQSIALNRCFDLQYPTQSNLYNYPTEWDGPAQLTVTRWGRVVSITSKAAMGALVASIHLSLTFSEKPFSENPRRYDITRVDLSGSATRGSETTPTQLVRVPPGSVPAACAFHVM
jgi:hypothetical protein